MMHKSSNIKVHITIENLSPIDYNKLNMKTIEDDFFTYVSAYAEMIRSQYNLSNDAEIRIE